MKKMKKMKKLLALSFALALTFSTTVCAADYNESYYEGLAEKVDKSLPEYASNAVAGPNIVNVWKISDIASGSDMIIAGEETNATCVVDKVDMQMAGYAVKKGMEVGGFALVAANLSAPGVNLADAQVKLYVENVKAGDPIQVYKCVKGVWEPVTVTAVTDNCVQIVFDYQGSYTIIKTAPVR